MKSLILFTSRNCFSSLASGQPPRSCQYCALSFQNTLDVISLERGDFELSIGGLNSMFPLKKIYMVQESLNILQSTLCWQSQDFNMATNMKEDMTEL